jgi:hypothetical protein
MFLISRSRCIVPFVFLFSVSAAMLSTTTMSGARRSMHQRSTFSKDWLSDPSTYPIIFTLSFATVMAATFIGYKVAFCNDVRVTSKAKGHVIRTWA